MQSEINAIVDALMGPLEGAMAGTEAAMMSLWSALITIAVGFGFLSAVGSMSDAVHRTIRVITTAVLAIVPVRYNQEIVDWTVDQANVFAGLAGAGTVRPWELMTLGLETAELAFWHADAVMSWIFFTGILQAAALALTGMVIFICYAFLTALAIFCWVELMLAAFLLLPMFVFLGIAGFGAASLSGIGFIASATLRLAGFGLLGGVGAELLTDDRFALPQPWEEITWLQTAITLALSFLLAGAAWSINAVLVTILMGRTGWTGPAGAIVSAFVSSAASAATALAGGSTGGSGGGGSGGVAAAAAGGSGGGGSGTVQPRSTPVNSRARP